MKKKRALISVWDKTGADTLARGLCALGYEILSTGQTAAFLSKAGIPVQRVEDVTGFPEILGGRVKTLHPAVFAGILAGPDDGHQLEIRRQGIAPISVVAVNLYPFAETVARPDATEDQAVETIDIGGPSLLRAAAKNFAGVTVLCDPGDYGEALARMQARRMDRGARRNLAARAFAHTAAYEAAIAGYWQQRVDPDGLPERFCLSGSKIADLRYGENPHQAAALYGTRPGGLAQVPLLQGKPLSYNNLADLAAAVGMAAGHGDPVCILVKHTNPCGAARAPSAVSAWRAAHACDPQAAFGAVAGFNRTVDLACAREIASRFVEAVAAPGFTASAREHLAAKPDLRLVAVDPAEGGDPFSVRPVPGGFLLQQNDPRGHDEPWEWVGKTPPSESWMEDLRFAWSLVGHVQSNAIVVVRDGAAVGIGPGQTSRIGAARIALAMAGERAAGAVLASDAFFPFRDVVDEAARCGIVAIVQPGGSRRDAESVEACDEAGIAMARTGRRHFRH